MRSSLVGDYDTPKALVGDGVKPYCSLNMGVMWLHF